MSDNVYDYIQRDISMENNYNNNNNDYIDNIDLKKIEEINELLHLRGHPIIDFSNKDNFNLNFFLDIIRILIEENEKIIKNNIDIKQKILRKEDENLNLKSKITFINQEKNRLEDNIIDKKNKIKFFESKIKNQLSLFENEKEELNKTIIKVTLKENAFKNEINKLKKEQLNYIDRIKSMQEKLDENLHNQMINKGLKVNQNLSPIKMGNI